MNTASNMLLEHDIEETLAREGASTTSAWATLRGVFAEVAEAGDFMKVDLIMRSSSHQIDEAVEQLRELVEKGEEPTGPSSPLPPLAEKLEQVGVDLTHVDTFVVARTHARRARRITTWVQIQSETDRAPENLAGRFRKFQEAMHWYSHGFTFLIFVASGVFGSDAPGIAPTVEWMVTNARSAAVHASAMEQLQDSAA